MEFSILLKNRYAEEILRRRLHGLLRISFRVFRWLSLLLIYNLLFRRYAAPSPRRTAAAPNPGDAAAGVFVGVEAAGCEGAFVGVGVDCFAALFSTILMVLGLVSLVPILMETVYSSTLRLSVVNVTLHFPVSSSGTATRALYEADVASYFDAAANLVDKSSTSTVSPSNLFDFPETVKSVPCGWEGN